MIYNFRIVSDEIDNFKREIKIDADATFLDFKNAICDSVSFDKNQMSSFFLCEDNWEKIREITLEDMGSDSAEEIFLMEDTIISDHVDDIGQRLIFTYDYLTDRSFFIELKEIITGKTLKDPLCTLSIGNPPPQNIDIDEFEKKVDSKATALSADDFDEEFYGNDAYNDDEFDGAGFDEMKFED